MEEHGIPHPDETVIVLQQNRLQKIPKQRQTNPTTYLPSIILGLLDKADRPSLDDHIHYLGPQQLQPTGNKLKAWNRILGLAFLLLWTCYQPIKQNKIPGTVWPSMAIPLLANSSHIMVQETRC